MLRRLLWGLCLAMIAIHQVEAAPPKVPAPPHGFRWVGAPEMGCFFLQPDGWFAKKERKGDTEALFIT